MATPTIESLLAKHAAPVAAGTKALGAGAVKSLLSLLPGWKQERRGEIARTFAFENYHQTMAFVNAVAFVAHREDHHPDMEVHYNRCVVRYSTHSVGGLSENDFICAAKVNALQA